MAPSDGNSRGLAHTGYTDLVQVRRAYKFRAYPTRPQEGRGVRLLADHCDLYNAALMERREAWRMRQARVSYAMQSAQLTEIRKADPEGQGRHSFTAQQQTLRRLDAVFGAFFGRVRAAQKSRENTTKPGYPRFKPYQRFSQVRFVNGDGATWVPADGHRWARARFQAGSGNRKRLRRALAQEWRKVRNRRRDFHHRPRGRSWTHAT